MPHGEREQLLERIKADREDGIEELRRVLRRVRIHNARTQLGKAFNYHALKALYSSQPVGALALNILEAENRCRANELHQFATDHFPLERGLGRSGRCGPLQRAQPEAIRQISQWVLTFAYR